MAHLNSRQFSMSGEVGKRAISGEVKGAKLSSIVFKFCCGQYKKTLRVVNEGAALCDMHVERSDGRSLVM